MNEVTEVQYNGWVNGWFDPCRHQDMCGQLVINTYSDIAKFEEILGEKIPNLLTYKTYFVLFQTQFNLKFFLIANEWNSEMS